MGLILGTQQLAANLTQTLPDNSLRRSPIKVALLSLPPRTHSLLEFFFTNAGRGSFVASGEDQAETAIFDLDTPASREHWGSYNSRTGRPGIALAVKQQEVVGALWVQKPVTPAALLAAAAALRARDFAAPAPVPLAAPAPEPVAQARAQDASLPVAPVVPAPQAAMAAAPVSAELERSTVTKEASAAAPPLGPQLAEQPTTSADAMPTTGAEPPQEPVGVTSSDPAVADTPTNTAETGNRGSQDVDPAAGLPAADPVASGTSEATVTAKRSSGEEGKGLRRFWKRVFGTPERADAPADLPSSKLALTGTATGSQTAEPAPQAAAAKDPQSPSESDKPAIAHADDDVHLAEAPAADTPVCASLPTDVGAGFAPEAAGHQAQTLPASAASALSAADSGAPGASLTPAPSQPEGTMLPETPASPAQEAAEEPKAALTPADDHGAASPIRETAVSAHAAPEQQAALFGTRDDVSVKDLAESPELRYDPEQHLVGALREAFLVATKWQVPTQIDCGGGFIVVNAERNELHASLDEAQLQELSRTPLARRSKVQTLTNLEYVQFKQSLEASGKGHVHRLDDSLWKAALWGSAGRLPKGTQPARTLYLRQWPNLTRITPIPQGARLSAMWALRGASVVDSCKQFSLPQRQVIGFYNGVWALNLLTEDGSLARRATRKGARNRGLLTRLLGWLRR
jgi:hypothetical protein